MMERPRVNGRIDVDQPRWLQDTFMGRMRYFLGISDLRLAIVSEKKLTEARDLLDLYRHGQEPQGTTEEQIWYAKQLRDSAFHPDSGELQNVIGRMSFQVPGGMLLTAGMLQFYKSNSAVILWQWMNQSFNALVNYTNRNAASSLTPTQMGVAYVSATGCAVVTALGLKSLLAKRASPMFQRFVPFMAVAAANCVNIPLTRQSELTRGIQLVDENNTKVTESRFAATKGISQVITSRIVITAPGMLAMPFIMEALEKKRWFMRIAPTHLAFQTCMLGTFLVVMVPVGCSLFSQRSCITLDRLKQIEGQRYEEVLAKFAPNDPPERLYFNKGL